MNIIVKPYGSDLCYCRPDTTWERENRDFYSPECVNEVLWTPIVFARVSKAGKCIGRKFAERYYDGIGCGMLMYCVTSEMQTTSCADHTSVLPMPLYDPVVLEGVKNFEANGSSILLDDAKNMLEDALCNASKMTSIRIGDFVAVELSPLTHLASRNEDNVTARGSFCDNESFNFEIIF